MAGFGQGLRLGFDVGLVAGLDRGFGLRNRGFDPGLVFRRNLVAEVLQRFLHRVHHAVGLVARGGQFERLVVFGGVGFGVLHHLLDFRLAQAGVGLDRDLGFLAGALVLGGNVQDAVGVDVEGDFDLRHAALRRRDVGQVELAQALVAGGDFALTLQNVDGHCGLIVVGSGEHLIRPGRDGGVLRDQLGHHAAERFDTQAERGDVEQQHVLDVALQHAALDRGADGDGLIRVDVLARVFTKEFLHQFLHLGHAGHAADQDHVGDVGDFDAGILDRHLARLDGALDQFFNQALELGAGDLHDQVFRAGSICCDVRQIDFGLGVRRQLDLGLFRRFLQALQRQHVLLQIDALLFLELVDDPVDQALVEVFAAEEGVAVGGQHFELMLAVDFGDFDDRDIERAAAQVIHRDLAIAFLLVHAERQRGRSRLVDDALDFQTGDAAGVLGGLTLRIVEVGRYGDDRFGDFFAQVILGGFLHLAQHFGGNLRRCGLLVAHFHPGVAVVGLDDLVGHQGDVLLHFLLFEAAADQTLDRVQRVLRVGDRLPLGRCAGQNFAIFGISDDRRRRARAFRVFNDLGLAAFHDCHTGVGGAQVDTNDLAHFYVPLNVLNVFAKWD